MSGPHRQAPPGPASVVRRNPPGAITSRSLLDAALAYAAKGRTSRGPRRQHVVDGPSRRADAVRTRRGAHPTGRLGLDGPVTGVAARPGGSGSGGVSGVPPQATASQSPLGAARGYAPARTRILAVARDGGGGMRAADLRPLAKHPQPPPASTTPPRTRRPWLSNPTSSREQLILEDHVRDH